DFTWQAPQDGGAVVRVHRYLENRQRFPEPVPVLMDRQADMPTRKYRPLIDEPNLFLRFAETEPTAEGALCFANRYGRLGPDAQLRIRPAGPQDEIPGASCFDVVLNVRGLGPFAEPLVAWQMSIVKCAHLVRLWGLATQGDEGRAELARLIK